MPCEVTSASNGQEKKPLTVAQKCYWVTLVVLHASLLAVESYNLHSWKTESPMSPTIEGKTQWDVCSNLGIWSVSWRFILNISGALFAISTLCGGTKASVRIVAHSMLAYMVWFMSGPFLLYNNAAECAVAAPRLLRLALESYATFTVYALVMMFLFSLAAFKGVRKARAAMKARKEAEAAAKVAQEAELEKISEKAPIALAQAVPEGHLVDVKTEELV